ncbi:MAG TPA: hypothetical protein VF729_10640 [Solirubrobacterales bacterium]
MLKRRQAKKREINAEPGERVLWLLVERLRDAADGIRWPLERLAWGVEERLLWPLQERAAVLPAPGRMAGAVALAGVALAAVAIGVLSLSGGGGDEPAAPIAVTPAAAPTPAPPEEPDAPKLEGVAPSFGTGGVAAGKSSDSGEASVEPSGVDTSAAVAVPPSADDEAGAATSSSEKPVPAGPAAMKVARRFSEAFVLYEIGERPARASAVFAETATPRLATALAERPPRLPAGTEVPQARVVNLVPGPRRGRAYTVSASLLRVGVTSELRLQMKNQAGNWVVTDVRG